MSTKKLIIAIDGPAGSGKSTTAQALAKRLKIPYIDTGAMYRALTLKAMQLNILFTETERLVELSKKVSIELVGEDPQQQKVFLDGQEVTKEIRLPELTKNVFYVAQEPLIRREMVKKQRAMGQNGGAVMEGRDIGTVVFPNADYKFYFIASEDIRAVRRQKDLIAAGKSIELDKMREDIKKRDETDYNRKEGPLKQAEDAILIDTSSLTIEGTVDKIIGLMQSNPLNNRRLDNKCCSKSNPAAD